jgi:hypothetical protein
MTKKNKNKVAARARKEAHGGKYQSHLRAVGGGDGKPLGLFEIISDAIREAYPHAKLSFDDPMKRLDVRIGVYDFAFLTPHNSEPEWPVTAWKDAKSDEDFRDRGSWDCMSIDDVLTVLRWPDARPSGSYTSVNEIRDDYENPSKHVWARVGGNALEALFKCEGCEANVHVRFGDTVEEMARMGYQNWRDREAGALKRPNTITRSMSVGFIPPQCSGDTKLRAAATDEASTDSIKHLKARVMGPTDSIKEGLKSNLAGATDSIKTLKSSLHRGQFVPVLDGLDITGAASSVVSQAAAMSDAVRSLHKAVENPLGPALAAAERVRSVSPLTAAIQPSAAVVAAEQMRRITGEDSAVMKMIRMQERITGEDTAITKAIRAQERIAKLGGDPSDD